MSDLTFDYRELDEFVKEIDQWPGLALSYAQPAMQDTVVFLLGRIPEAPPASAKVVVRPDGASFLTDKQRAWFFAAVQANDIPGWRWVESQQVILTERTAGERAPYLSNIKRTRVGGGHPEKFASARSGDLERRFTTGVEKDKESVAGSLGNSVAYAPWVVGGDYPGDDVDGEKKYQAKIHEGQEWYQFPEVIASNIDDAWKKFDEKFWPEFQKAVVERKGKQ